MENTRLSPDTRIGYLFLLFVSSFLVDICWSSFWYKNSAALNIVLVVQVNFRDFPLNADGNSNRTIRKFAVDINMQWASIRIEFNSIFFNQIVCVCKRTNLICCCSMTALTTCYVIQKQAVFRFKCFCCDDLVYDSFKSVHFFLPFLNGNFHLTIMIVSIPFSDANFYVGTCTLWNCKTV